ncbi:hypothetical protein DMUE_0863 [Dictyocoela muelleri]|nr:hypothetical protein DMUE_0863 [Dictyocoela muelleri]
MMKIKNNYLNLFKLAIKQRLIFCRKCLSGVSLISKNRLRCRKASCREDQVFLSNNLFKNEKNSIDQIGEIIFYWLKKYRVSQIYELLSKTLGQYARQFLISACLFTIIL